MGITDLDPWLRDFYWDIGDQIRKLRKERTSLSYIDFAEEIGMNRKTYYKIETGSSEYHISSLMRILEYYPDISAGLFFKSIGW